MASQGAAAPCGVRGGCAQRPSRLLRAPQLRRALRRPARTAAPLVWLATAAARASLRPGCGAAPAAAAAARAPCLTAALPARDVRAAARGRAAGGAPPPANYDSGSESESESGGAAVTGLSMSQLLERHSVIFPVQAFSSKQTQRAVRVWARHVGVTGDLASLAIVDAPKGPGTRGAVAWRGWTAARWEAAAKSLNSPLDESACIRMRSLTGRGRSSWHIVWGSGSPLGAAPGAAPPVPFVYVFVPGGMDRFVALSELRSLAAQPGAATAASTLASASESEESEEEDESGGSSRARRVTFIWEEARTQLDALMQQNAALAATAAAALGLPASADASAVMAHPALARLAGLRQLETDEEAETAASEAAAAAAEAMTQRRAALVAASRARAAAVAAAAAAPPAAAALKPGAKAAAPAFGDDDEESEDELDEDAARASEEAAAAAAERMARAAANAEAAALAAEEAAASAASRAIGGGELWDPSTSTWGGLSAADLLTQKGVAFGFLSLLERVRLIKGRAAASGFPVDPVAASAWGRAAWDRAADEMGIVFFDAGWYAPLRRLPAGWHAAWCPDRGGWALYLAAPSAAGARFFTLAALHALTATQPPPGLPRWRDTLEALREAASAQPGLAKALDAELSALDAAATRQRKDAGLAAAGAAGPQGARAGLAAPAPRGAEPAAPQPPPQALPAADAAAAAPPAAADVADAGASDKQPGLSPVDLYLQLGLGFAFMRLGSADSKRIVRAAAAAAQQPLGPADGGWDKADWVAASEQLQLTWLPEGTHSSTLPSLGRGVRAAWGAGRVYVYAPAPVDRFMQTPLIKAGYCDAALRPASAKRGEPFAAWARTVDALAEAAASNTHLRAALLADAVFPKELLPPPEEEEGDDEAGAAEDAAVAESEAAWAAGSDDDGGEGDGLADFADDDSLFAPSAAVPERPRVNFAPNGMTLPKTEMLSMPWNEPDYVDEVLERFGAPLTKEEHAALRGWPALPELEAHGVVLNDTAFRVLSLHSCDIFVRQDERGRLDLREAYGVDKTGVLDGMSEEWSYTDTWWPVPSEAPPDLPLAHYQPVTWTRRPTLTRTRGDRRLGEQTYMADWAEEHKRIYLVRRAGDDPSLPAEDQPLDFRTVFALDDQTGHLLHMPVVGLLEPVTPAAGKATKAGAGGTAVMEAPAEAEVEYRESWDLPADAHLCISWDYLYVNVPERMESSEDLAYEWLTRNRYKLRPDGTMTGTPLVLDLPPEQAARMAAEERAEEQERRTSGSPAAVAAAAAAEAEAAARAEAMEQMDREGLNEELDIPEIDLM